MKISEDIRKYAALSKLSALENAPCELKLL